MREVDSILQSRETAGWVPEPEAKTIFRAAGIPVANFSYAANRQEAFVKADRIGYPVAAKAVSVKIIHKSDHGGVRINIGSPDELAVVWDSFEKLEAFEGMVIDEMVQGLELFLGARDDEQFGPVVLLGIGGTGVEIYKDVAIRMAPLGEADVDSMIHELKGKAFILGHRGSPSVNIDILINAVIRFSQLAMSLERRFTSMDINPFMCGPDRCVAVDGRIML
jgi:succinyl-CoA synthetase beta subunit